MRKLISIGILLSSILCALTPCINAIEINVLKEKIEADIESKINAIQSKLHPIKNTGFISSILFKILVIIYGIGYFAFIPFLFRIGFTPYGENKPIVILIKSLLASFLWPFILIYIIKVLNYSNKNSILRSKYFHGKK
jgi:hypothetical protein